MTVFKYYFKVLKQYKFLVVLYTVLLVFFGAFSLQTSDTTASFEASKPNVYLINHDEEGKLAASLCQYIQKNATIKELKNDDNAINDALFYRDINAIIDIPENYSADFMNGQDPSINIQKTGDSQSEYMEMLLGKYLKVADIYQSIVFNEEELINKIEEVVQQTANVEITSKLNTNALEKATFYYNFANYSMLAGCVFVITMVMSSFKAESIKKRTNISSMKTASYNRYLFLGNLTFAAVLWLFYVLISFILVKEAMLTVHGLFYILNSFIFMISCVAIAFLISNILSSKNAINGIVNVVALGTSFLCGAFVPVELLTDSVLKVAHVLPSYWYIQNNELLSTIETFHLTTLQPYIINCIVTFGFAILLIILTNIISRIKIKKF